MKYLASKKYNLLLTIFITILCFILFHKSGILEGAGMAALILNWIPIIIGILTFVLFLIIYTFTKKYAWIVIALGNTLNLILIIKAFWEAGI